MRPLAVGVQLPEAEREVRWPELRRMIRLIEDSGFDSIWVGDHLLYRPDGAVATGPWEAWTLLAAIAVETERVAFGPLVAATSFHAPAMLAKKAATIDELSGGRLVLGLGAGWNEIEYRAFGFPFDHRASRFEEAFTIIRTLLREGSIDFEGDWYSARECELAPRGPRAEGPPLMIGSRGPRVLAASLPYVDLWNAWYTWFGNDVEGLHPLLREVDRACEQAGRDPAEVERTVAYYLGLTGSTGRPAGHEGRQRAAPKQGPPEIIAADLAAYADAGVSQVQLVLDPITLGSIEEAAMVLEALDRP